VPYPVPEVLREKPSQVKFTALSTLRLRISWGAHYKWKVIGMTAEMKIIAWVSAMFVEEDMVKRQTSSWR